MSNKIFYLSVAGFTFGIFLSSFFKLGFVFSFFLIILAIFIFFFGKFFAESKNIIILLSVFIFSFSLGIIRYEISEIAPMSDPLVNLVDQKVNLTGIVIDEPNVKDQNVDLVVRIDGLKVLVSTGLYPEFNYGDKVQMSGKLEKPKNFVSTTTNEFDYIGFLAKDDIFYKISFANAQIVSSGHGSIFRSKLFLFKKAFMNNINSLIKEPESSLLGGLLLGAKNSLGKAWQEDFRKAGVSHIVALSGYNITIIAEGVMLALSFLPRFLGLTAGAIGIILFAVMVGGSATVLRASIMALLVLLAKSTGRTYDVVRALLLAGVFMLIQNPKVLVFDISFQLSFLATVALILVSPILEIHFSFIKKYFIGLAEKLQLRELLIATTATQIFVLPFIFYKMGMISVVSLPANLLILPVIPSIMLFGFVTGMIGFISPLLATPFAFITSIMLSYLLKVISLSASLPFSALTIKDFPLPLVVIIYLVFFVIIWRYQIDAQRPTNSN